MSDIAQIIAAIREETGCEAEAVVEDDGTVSFTLIPRDTPAMEYDSSLIQGWKWV